MVAARIGAK